MSLVRPEGDKEWRHVCGACGYGERGTSCAGWPGVFASLCRACGCKIWGGATRVCDAPSSVAPSSFGTHTQHTLLSFIATVDSSLYASCPAVDYHNPKMVVGCIVEHQGQLLLCRWAGGTGGRKCKGGSHCCAGGRVGEFWAAQFH